jgi:hypothetical protein
VGGEGVSDRLETRCAGQVARPLAVLDGHRERPKTFFDNDVRSVGSEMPPRREALLRFGSVDLVPELLPH